VHPSLLNERAYIRTIRGTNVDVDGGGDRSGGGGGHPPLSARHVSATQPINDVDVDRCEARAGTRSDVRKGEASVSAAVAAATSNAGLEAGPSTACSGDEHVSKKLDFGASADGDMQAGSNDSGDSVIQAEAVAASHWPTDTSVAARSQPTRRHHVFFECSTTFGTQPCAAVLIKMFGAADAAPEHRLRGVVVELRAPENDPSQPAAADPCSHSSLGASSARRSQSVARPGPGPGAALPSMTGMPPTAGMMTMLHGLMGGMTSMKGDGAGVGEGGGAAGRGGGGGGRGAVGSSRDLGEVRVGGGVILNQDPKP
jgi:hypothetical protein